MTMENPAFMEFLPFKPLVICYIAIENGDL